MALNVRMPSPIQQVVLATSMAGVAIVFILTGRPPGWLAYLFSGLVSVLFLVAAALKIRGSNLLGLAALMVLLVMMFWKDGSPASLVTGIVLALGAVLAARARRKQAADSTGDAPLPEPEGDE
jgi:hypothetical protein